MPHASNKQVWLAYGMGIVSGVLSLLIYRELNPPNATDELQQFVDVSEFVDRTFVKDLDSNELVTRSLKGLVSSLDPYSRYYDPKEAAQEEQETAGEYLGIGVVLRLIDEKQRVLFPMPNSPAALAGLSPGDEVVAVGGVATQGLAWTELAERMRGPQGSSVTLDLRNLDGQERQVDVQRALVPDPSVRHAQILPDTPGLAYLTIRSFSRRTSEEFDAALAGLASQGMRGLIVDLRGNRGGVMEAALQVADRFVTQGLLLRTESRDLSEEHFAHGDATQYPDLPLVLLVDGHSASASEILAGALQDHRRAALVGVPTYGKGMVQTIRSFGRYGTKAKVTSAYYYSPSGRLFERSAEEGRDYGIIPDVQIELSSEQANTTLAYLESYSVPEPFADALHQFEDSLARELVPSIPRDEHLVAALDLLQGIHPSARLEGPK